MGQATIPITIDKSHLTTIGRRLYSESLDLVRELVANAYDADATVVKINLAGGGLTVWDNGLGMDRNGLVQYFTIGSGFKKTNPVTEKFNRRRIGEFGIGKFAVLSVCDRFELATQKNGYAATVIFDKNDFVGRNNWEVPLFEQEQEKNTALAEAVGAGVFTQRLAKKKGALAKVSQLPGEISRRLPKLTRNRVKTILKDQKRLVKKLKIGGVNIVCSLSRLGPDQPESFTEGGVIFINRDHPLFTATAHEPDLAAFYLARLITQELVLLAQPGNIRTAYDWQSRLLTDAIIDKNTHAQFKFNGDVVVPIHLATTFARQKVNQPTGGYEYSRSGNPTRLAAETNLLFLLKADDHIIVSDDVYGGTKRLFDQVFKPFNLTFSYVDLSGNQGYSHMEKAIKKNTKLVWIESPTNPLLKTADIRKITSVSRTNKFLHSTIKYLGGHSDTVGGAIITSNQIVGCCFGGLKL